MKVGEGSRNDVNTVFKHETLKKKLNKKILIAKCSCTYSSSKHLGGRPWQKDQDMSHGELQSKAVLKINAASLYVHVFACISPGEEFVLLQKPV